jgi:hypothetical protein
MGSDAIGRHKPLTQTYVRLAFVGVDVIRGCANCARLWPAPLKLQIIKEEHKWIVATYDQEGAGQTIGIVRGALRGPGHDLC